MFSENKYAYEPQNMCKFRLVLDFGLKILSEIYLMMMGRKRSVSDGTSGKPMFSPGAALLMPIPIPLGVGIGMF
jgi:hypothetical protein